jgi:peptide/nickel transport system substrate-binding protein
MRLRNAITIVAVFALFAMACGDDDATTTTAAPATTQAAGGETTEAPATTATPATTVAPEAGGALTITRYEVFGGWLLDAAAAYGDYSTQLAVMEPLLRFGEDGIDLYPGLAESWVYDPDGLTVTFTLQEGARFSNGDPVTAEDVEFSLGVWREGPNFGASWDSVAAVSGEGREVVLELLYPDNTIESIMSSSVSGIMPKDFAGMTADEFYQNPIGAGAFVVAEWSPTRIVLTPNEFFYDPERPKVDEVVLEVLTDEVERQILFEAGDTQINELLSQTIAPQYDPADIYFAREHAIEHLSLNVLRPPFDDPLVREAVAYAIDYEAIVAGLGEEYYSLPTGILPPNIRNWVPPTEPYYRRDLAKAQDLMDQSSAAGGVDVELLFDSGAEIYPLMGQILQVNLAEIGINVTLAPLETGGFLDRAYSIDADMTMWGYGAITPDMSDPMFWIMSTGWLFSGQETDTLFGDFLTYAEAPDEAGMHAVVTKIQDEAFTYAASIAVAQGHYLFAVDQNLTGFWSAPWPLSYWDTIALGG